MNAIEFTATPHGKKSGRELQMDLEKVFERFKGVTPFQDIDPVEWQRGQRREWQKRTA